MRACTTEGCANKGVPIDLPDDVPAVCGPCGEPLPVGKPKPKRSRKR